MMDDRFQRLIKARQAATARANRTTALSAFRVGLMLTDNHALAGQFLGEADLGARRVLHQLDVRNAVASLDEDGRRAVEAMAAKARGRTRGVLRTVSGSGAAEDGAQTRVMRRAANMLQVAVSSEVWRRVGGESAADAGVAGGGGGGAAGGRRPWGGGLAGGRAGAHDAADRQQRGPRRPGLRRSGSVWVIRDLQMWRSCAGESVQLEESGRGGWGQPAVRALSEEACCGAARPSRPARHYRGTAARSPRPAAGRGPAIQ